MRAMRKPASATTLLVLLVLAAAAPLLGAHAEPGRPRARKLVAGRRPSVFDVAAAARRLAARPPASAAAAAADEGGDGGEDDEGPQEPGYYPESYLAIRAIDGVNAKTKKVTTSLSTIALLSLGAEWVEAGELRPVVLNAMLSAYDKMRFTGLADRAKPQKSISISSLWTLTSTFGVNATGLSVTGRELANDIADGKFAVEFKPEKESCIYTYTQVYNTAGLGSKFEVEITSKENEVCTISFLGTLVSKPLSFSVENFTSLVAAGGSKLFSSLACQLDLKTRQARGKCVSRAASIKVPAGPVPPKPTTFTEKADEAYSQLDIEVAEFVDVSSAQISRQGSFDPLVMYSWGSVKHSTGNSAYTWGLEGSWAGEAKLTDLEGVTLDKTNTPNEAVALKYYFAMSPAEVSIAGGYMDEGGDFQVNLQHLQPSTLPSQLVTPVPGGPCYYNYVEYDMNPREDGTRDLLCLVTFNGTITVAPELDEAARNVAGLASSVMINLPRTGRAVVCTLDLDSAHVRGGHDKCVGFNNEENPTDPKNPEQPNEPEQPEQPEEQATPAEEP